jgi:hypothetical protein
MGYGRSSGYGIWDVQKCGPADILLKPA